MEEGGAPNQVAAYGMGEGAPVATNNSTAGRQLNRRVEIAISNPGSQTTGAL
jgi:outer membrane protein OmpA-like peptidoglycan-associated protein